MFTNVEFTPSNRLTPQAKMLGWGKFFCGPVWINFNVFVSDKTPLGFFVSLPSEKNPTTGKYFARVGFIDRSYQEQIEAIIAPMVQQAIMNARSLSVGQQNNDNQSGGYRQYNNTGGQQSHPVELRIPQEVIDQSNQKNQPPFNDGPAPAPHPTYISPSAPASQSGVSMGGNARPNPNVPPANNGMPNLTRNPMMRGKNAKSG